MKTDYEKGYEAGYNAGFQAGVEYIERRANEDKEDAGWQSQVLNMPGKTLNQPTPDRPRPRPKGSTTTVTKHT